MTEREPTHPNFGHEARVEWNDREVRLIFVADSAQMAKSLARSILGQLQQGEINITMKGKPTKVEITR